MGSDKRLIMLQQRASGQYIAQSMSFNLPTCARAPRSRHIKAACRNRLRQKLPQKSPSPPPTCMESLFLFKVPACDPVASQLERLHLDAYRGRLLNDAVSERDLDFHFHPDAVVWAGCRIAFLVWKLHQSVVSGLRSTCCVNSSRPSKLLVRRWLQVWPFNWWQRRVGVEDAGGPCFWIVCDKVTLNRPRRKLIVET